MMRRLFIITICAAAVGTAHCAPVGNDWTKQHDEVAKILHSAEADLRAYEADVANGVQFSDKANAALNKVGQAIKRLHAIPKEDLSAKDASGKTLSDYAAPVIGLGSPAGLSGHLHELQAALQGKSMSGN